MRYTTFWAGNRTLRSNGPCPKCGWREAWERSDLADRNPWRRALPAGSVYRLLNDVKPVCNILPYSYVLLCHYSRDASAKALVGGLTPPQKRNLFLQLILKLAAKPLGGYQITWLYQSTIIHQQPKIKKIGLFKKYLPELKYKLIFFRFCEKHKIIFLSRWHWNKIFIICFKKLILF